MARAAETETHTISVSSYETVPPTPLYHMNYQNGLGIRGAPHYSHAKFMERLTEGQRRVAFKPNTRYIFVISRDGNHIRYIEERPGSGPVGHTSVYSQQEFRKKKNARGREIGADAVKYAGHFTTGDLTPGTATIISWSNDSGHWKPLQEFAYYIALHWDFSDHFVTLSGTETTLEKPTEAINVEVDSNGVLLNQETKSSAAAPKLPKKKTAPKLRKKSSSTPDYSGAPDLSAPDLGAPALGARKSSSPIDYSGAPDLFAHQEIFNHLGLMHGNDEEMNAGLGYNGLAYGGSNAREYGHYGAEFILFVLAALIVAGFIFVVYGICCFAAGAMTRHLIKKNKPTLVCADNEEYQV